MRRKDTLLASLLNSYSYMSWLIDPNDSYIKDNTSSTNVLHASERFVINHEDTAYVGYTEYSSILIVL
jgi:hypothetical protein